MSYVRFDASSKSKRSPSILKKKMYSEWVDENVTSTPQAHGPTPSRSSVSAQSDGLIKLCKHSVKMITNNPREIEKFRKCKNLNVATLRFSSWLNHTTCKWMKSNRDTSKSEESSRQSASRIFAVIEELWKVWINLNLF